ncbi:MAG: uroporphyrinogen-III synthase [Saprospiraceae bacterium]
MKQLSPEPLEFRKSDIMKKSTVFISRELAPESEFLQLVQAAGFEVVAKSLVTFRAVPFSTLPPVDWIFFYSKQAIQFFFEQVRQQNLTINAKLAVFGKGTAKALEQEMYQADFVGIGEPELNARHFALQAQGQSVLFPRAANSRLSIQQLLENKIEAFDLIVYENQPITNIDLPECEWLVFTSPLNAKAYFAQYTLQAMQRVLAIGKTTAQTLQQMGIANVTIAEEPSEMALAQVICRATQS